tara:strand:- start:248 stop:490 length:243 start_codon:yes stop_codon:yes gene_type:complete
MSKQPKSRKPLKVNITANKESEHLIIAVVGIMALLILETLALMKGINGHLLRGVMIAIGALAGLAIPAPKFNKLLEVFKK